jgi:hypothetical protein
MSTKNNSTRKAFIALIEFLVLAGFFVFTGAKAIAQPTCPKVNGTWQRQIDGLTMTIGQTGCDITSSFASGGFNHELTGKWSDSLGFFDGRVARQNKTNGCQTIMSVEIRRQNSEQLKLNTTGTDGKCELPTNYKEEFIWTKQ